MIALDREFLKPFLAGGSVPRGRRIRRQRVETIVTAKARKRGRGNKSNRLDVWSTGKSVVLVESADPVKKTRTIIPEPSGSDIQSPILTSDPLVSKVPTEMTNSDDKDGAMFDAIATTFPFELDNFQSVAIKELLSGKSVVVCAPTGAGKTAIADAAAMSCLARGKRTIYTTPLKALSNQKLQEFRQRFGVERTGLVTGDINIHVDAPVVVMTTEILRNMIYEVGDERTLRMGRLEDIGLVVLDEVHYLGDPGRGSVWEELIVGCPKNIQILCMSATVANPQDLGDWISQIHGPCSTVKTSKRPVPLSWYFSMTKTNTKKPQILHLLNESRTDVNPDCLVNKEPELVTIRAAAARIPPMHRLIHLMEDRGFLPAIFFIFSRADCDRQAMAMGQIVDLTSPEEKRIIHSALAEIEDDQPEAVKTSCVDALIRGIATHHAGCLPAWKQLVESLFQSGCLKVVFATGTLAAGINMPARTTVITTLARKIDGEVKLLGHNELLQMAGRAGRRGYDTKGNCVIMQSRFEGAKEAIIILRKGTEPLISQFTTGYSLVLNLLAKFSLDEAKDFVTKSFQSYMTGIGLERRTEEIERLKEKTQKLKEDILDSETEEGEASYQEVHDAFIEASQELMTCQLAAKRERSLLAKEQCSKIDYPFPVLIDITKNASGKTPIAAYALGQKYPEDEDDASEKICCFGADNRFYCLPYDNIVGIIAETVEVTQELMTAKQQVFARGRKWKESAPTIQTFRGSEATGKLAFSVPTVGRFERITWSHATQLHLSAKTQLAQELKKENRKLHRLSMNDNDAGTKLRKRLKSTERQLRQALRLKKKLEQQQERGWDGFTDTLDILINVGAIDRDSLEIQPLGHVARELFGQNELWMAMVWTHPSVQLLKPSMVAALASCFVAADICARQSVSISVKPSREIEKVLKQLEPARGMLYETEVTIGSASQQSLMGLYMETRASGLVEAWADGCTWEQLTRSTSMDDGDLAYLLTRTRDILRQVFMSKHLLEPLREAANRARKAMHRKPIHYSFD